MSHNIKLPIIWLTGQPGSGKTTLSNKIKETLSLDNQFSNTEIVQIDGDDLRVLTENQDYSKEGRYANIRLGQNIALFCQNKGYLVIVSLVAPYIELREEFKSKTNIFEVYLHTTEKRGREKFFSKDYIKPKKDFISIDTTNKQIGKTTDEILTIYRQVATLA